MPQDAFAGDPKAYLAVAVLASVARTVRSAEAVLAVSEQGRPCFGSGSARGTSRWSQEGRADQADNSAKDCLRFWESCGCVGKDLAVSLGSSMG